MAEVDLWPGIVVSSLSACGQENAKADVALASNSNPGNMHFSNKKNFGLHPLGQNWTLLIRHRPACDPEL